MKNLYHHGMININGANNMKSLYTYINEWKYTSNTDVRKDIIPTEFPKTKEELFDIIALRLKDNIEEPYLLDIDTSKIKSMEDLFSNDESDYLYQNYSIKTWDIKVLDLHTWDTSNVEHMGGMFYKCGKLKKVILSSFDTRKVWSMDSMFEGCRTIETIDISNFDTSGLQSSDSMFLDCTYLKEIKIGNFDMSKNTNMNYMFSQCENLKTITGNINNWNVENVIGMKEMFAFSPELRGININGWKLNKKAQTHYMFYYCNKSIAPKWYKDPI